MGQVIDPNDRLCTGTYTFAGTANLPSNCVSDSNITASSQIASSKVIHLTKGVHIQSQANDVANAREIVYVARYSATIDFVQVAVDDAPTGGDKAYTVDVRKSTGGGAWATILTAVSSISSSTGNRSIVTPTLASTTLAANDLLAVVVTTSGSTGSQGKGLAVSVGVSERSLP